MSTLSFWWLYLRVFGNQFTQSWDRSVTGSAFLGAAAGYLFNYVHSGQKTAIEKLDLAIFGLLVVLSGYAIKHIVESFPIATSIYADMEQTPPRKRFGFVGVLALIWLLGEGVWVIRSVPFISLGRVVESSGQQGTPSKNNNSGNIKTGDNSPVTLGDTTNNDNRTYITGSLGFDRSGLIVPGSGPTPKMECLSYDKVHHVADGMKDRPLAPGESVLLTGGSKFISDKFPVNVLALEDKPILVLDKSPSGSFSVTVDVHDKDGKLVARIVNNKFTVNTNRIFSMEHSRKNVLVVTDEYGDDVLTIDFVNPHVIRVNAQLYLPGVKGKVVLSDKALEVEGERHNDNCFNRVSNIINIHPVSVKEPYAWGIPKESATSPTTEDGSAKPCPSSTGFCANGTHAVVIGSDVQGYDHGIVDQGKDDYFSDNRLSREQLPQTAANGDSVENMIREVEKYHAQAWAKLSEAERKNKKDKQAEIEARVRVNKGNPNAVVPILIELATQE